VERDVVADELVEILSFGGRAHRLDLPLEERDVAVEALRRLPGGELLEHRPHRVDLDQLGFAERAHARASERLGLDHPQELEVAERLADRRLARAELGSDPRLDEPLARLEVTADDPVEQDVLHLLSEHGSGDRVHDGRGRLSVTVSPPVNRPRPGSSASRRRRSRS
jgi:hypothetical protein